MAGAVEERFGGEVPSRLEDLVTLPGVGRKTANVVRSVAFDLPGLPVDTHVGRLSRRLGLTEHDDPVKVELELNRYLPAAERGRFSLRMILHGRRVCLADRRGAGSACSRTSARRAGCRRARRRVTEVTSTHEMFRAGRGGVLPWMSPTRIPPPGLPRRWDPPPGVARTTASL